MIGESSVQLWRRKQRRDCAAEGLPKRESTTWMEGSGIAERVRVISNRRSRGE